MARLQDFQTVTPTSNDKFLIIQSQGQGLSTIGTVEAKISNAVKSDVINTLADCIILEKKNGSIVSFNTDIAAKLLDCNTEITATQAGTGTPSPSNPRAISGFDEVEIVVTGKNIFSSSIVQGALYTSGSESSTTTTRVKTADYIVCNPNTQYVVSFNSGIIPVSAVYYDKNKVYISGDNLSEATFTTPLNCEYVRFGIAKTNTTQSITPSDVTQSQLEEGSTATTYEPFGTTHTITLPETIYGGTAELVGGNGVKTVVDKLDLGSLSWTRRTDTSVPIFQASLTDWGKAHETADIPYILCEMFNPVSATNVSQSGYDNSVAISADGKRIYIQCQTYTDATTFTNAVNGKYVVYELATPTTFNTTPEQIPTLSGENNIYSNAGNVDITYQETIGHKFGV